MSRNINREQLIRRSLCRCEWYKVDAFTRTGAGVDLRVLYMLLLAICCDSGFFEVVTDIEKRRAEVSCTE